MLEVLSDGQKNLQTGKILLIDVLWYIRSKPEQLKSLLSSTLPQGWVSALENEIKISLASTSNTYELKGIKLNVYTRRLQTKIYFYPCEELTQ